MSKSPLRIAVALATLVALLATLGPVNEASAVDPPAVGTVTRFTEGVEAMPMGITAGPDGNMWVAVANGIQRITPAGDVTTFPVGFDISPFMITAGSDGNLWFTTWEDGVGRMTPTGVVTMFPVFGPPAEAGDAHIWSIVSGPDGNLWFSSPKNNVIGRITTSGVVSTFASDHFVGTHALTAGVDGKLWFSYEQSEDGEEPTGIGSMTTAGVFSFLDEQHLAEQGLVGALALTFGSDGNLWAADYFGIARITPSGDLTKFRIVGDDRAPWDITTGADGNVWYVAHQSNQVVRVTPAGVMTQFPSADDGTPSSQWVNGIAAGPNGTVWFTNWGGSATTPGPQNATVSRVVTGSLPTCSAAPFVDVPTTHAFCGQIAWAADAGIVNGYPDDTFRPTERASREATAAFLYRDAGSPNGVDPVCEEAPFADVPVDHAFCGEIAWAAAEGITNGYPDDTFRPGEPVSRESTAAFLYRFAGEPDGADPACDTAPFADVPTTHAFCGEIDWTTQSGITNGYGDGTFRPTNPVDRQAMAAFLYRLDNTLL